MAASTDLWGNIDTGDLSRTPLLVLKEQAALLGKKTGNVIEAKVKTSVTANGMFVHRLFFGCAGS